MAPAGFVGRVGSTLARRAPRLPLWLLPVLLPLVLLGPFLAGGVVPFGDDILLLNYPLLSLLAHALRHGYPVLWNPYSGGGYGLAPFSALPFYPPTWLLDVLPVLSAMSWTYALDLAMAGLGAYLLAARLGIGRPARLLPAVIFPCSGFVLAHIYAGHYLEVGLICWLPATLAALHWAADAATLRAALWRGLLCGGPLGLMILANGASWLVFVDYPVGLVAVLLAAGAARRAGGDGMAAMARAAAVPLAALAAAGIEAALLGAAVLWPLAHVVGATVRGGAMSYHAAARISEPLLGLAMALAPDLFGSQALHTYWFPNPDAYYQEVYAYVGLLPLALAAAAVVVARRRRGVLLYAGLSLLGVLLALGDNTPLYGLAYHLVPGLDVARVPARWLLLSVLGVALLAGFGADALVGSRRYAVGGRQMEASSVEPSARANPESPGALPRQHATRNLSRPAAYRLLPTAYCLPLTIFVALGLLGVGLAAALPEAAHHGATIGPALVRLLVVGLVSGLAVVAAARLPRGAGVAVLLAVTLADLWTANGSLLQPLNPVPYYRSPAVDLARATEGAGRVWALDRAIPLRLGMMDRRTRDVQDYAPLTLSDYWLATHPDQALNEVDTGMARAVFDRYNERIPVLLGVSLVYAPRPLHDPDLAPLARLRVPRWGLLAGDWSHPGPHPGPSYVYRVVAPLAFAQPIYAMRTVQATDALTATFASSFNPHAVVLLQGIRGQESGVASAPNAHAVTLPRGPATAAAGGLPLPGFDALLGLWRRTLAPAPSCPRPLSADDTHPTAYCLLPTAYSTAGPGFVMATPSENAVLLRGTMPRSGVLLLDQVYDPNWTATVDGHAVPLLRADDILTALPLPAGRHAIILVYAPPAFLAGALLTLLGYAVLLGTLLVTTVRLRRRSQ